MKTTMSEMKNILEVIKSILGTEEMMNKLEDTAIKTIQSETHAHTERERAGVVNMISELGGNFSSLIFTGLPKIWTNDGPDFSSFA